MLKVIVVQTRGKHKRPGVKGKRNGPSMFRLAYKGKVVAGSAGGGWFKQKDHKAWDQRPVRMERQMVDAEAAWHALTFTQEHRERDREQEPQCYA